MPPHAFVSFSRRTQAAARMGGRGGEGVLRSNEYRAKHSVVQHAGQQSWIPTYASMVVALEPVPIAMT